MSSKSDRSKGAGSGVAMSAGDASQDLQPVRFGSSESEAQVRSLLSKADTMRVRVRLADEQDVEGHLFGDGDSSLVLALQLSGDGFLSSTTLAGRLYLRACIVNFHTSLADVEALPVLLARLGEEIDATLRRESVG